MFTGIVEETGILRNMKNKNGFYEVEIICQKVLEETKIGDSISTNGVCLTVKEISSDSFKADVMGETLNKTNLYYLKEGNKVNLERALRLCDRLGGHVVSGHVDGIGKIEKIQRESDGTWFTVKASKDILKYVVYKGSVTIDGISLTVAYVDDNSFKVSVIPHTLHETVLQYKTEGSVVNLECDVIGKYIERLLKFTEKNDENPNEMKTNINMDFLLKCGF